jgi:hypothetical protein
MKLRLLDGPAEEFPYVVIALESSAYKPTMNTMHIFGQVIGSQAVVIGLRAPKEQGAKVPTARLFIDEPKAAAGYLTALHSDGYEMFDNRQTRKVCEYLARELTDELPAYIRQQLTRQTTIANDHKRRKNVAHNLAST